MLRARWPARDSARPVHQHRFRDPHRKDPTTIQPEAVARCSQESVDRDGGQRGDADRRRWTHRRSVRAEGSGGAAECATGSSLAVERIRVGVVVVPVVSMHHHRLTGNAARTRGRNATSAGHEEPHRCGTTHVAVDDLHHRDREGVGRERERCGGPRPHAASSASSRRRRRSRQRRVGQLPDRARCQSRPCRAPRRSRVSMERRAQRGAVQRAVPLLRRRHRPHATGASTMPSRERKGIAREGHADAPGLRRAVGSCSVMDQGRLGQARVRSHCTITVPA